MGVGRGLLVAVGVVVEPLMGRVVVVLPTLVARWVAVRGVVVVVVVGFVVVDPDLDQLVEYLDHCGPDSSGLGG